MNRTENISRLLIDEPLDCQLLREKFASIYPISVWKTNGFFQDVDLLEINCHWLQFEPTKPSSHFLLAIVYVAVFVVGCVSNTLVVYILLRYCQHVWFDCFPDNLFPLPLYTIGSVI